LRALSITPTVWHLNEGHSAFSILEIAREQVASGAPTQDALAAAKAATVFTTHTPVPAGLDTFEFGLVERYFSLYWEALGLDREGFFDLARQDFEWGERFSMPKLALGLSALRNGVSKLHGEVSRELFSDVWPDRETDDVPIGHVTNGVHVETWLAPEMANLFHNYVGWDWLEAQDEREIWRAVAAIPDETLWRARRRLKTQLIRFLHDKAQQRWSLGKTTPRHVLWSGALFSPDALTIGFARRFATYKRATLLFHDMERLKRIVTSAERPVQFVFAGKAHPDDDAGKHLIQHICRVALEPEMAGRIAFVEDYDMQVGRVLTRGVDLWLNNPRRPREASGTSGEKAAMNGVPNLSVLDGWWAEGFDGGNGWAIGSEKTLDDEAEQDNRDAAALYDVLEDEIVPLYYERDHHGLPLGWLAKARASIQASLPQFGSRRMLKEYTGNYYVPLMQRP
jgi:starch phosphorylase